MIAPRGWKTRGWTIVSNKNLCARQFLYHDQSPDINYLQRKEVSLDFGLPNSVISGNEGCTQ